MRPARIVGTSSTPDPVARRGKLVDTIATPDISLGSASPTGNSPHFNKVSIDPSIYAHSEIVVEIDARPFRARSVVCYNKYSKFIIITIHGVAWQLILYRFLAHCRNRLNLAKQEIRRGQEF